MFMEKVLSYRTKRDEDLILGFEKNKTSLEKCDFILCTGLFEKKKILLNYYKKLA